MKKNNTNVLILSTVHISEEAKAWINAAKEKRFAVAVYDATQTITGWFIEIPSDYDAILNKENFPSAILDIISYAAAGGYRWAMLDHAASRITNLPIYE
ncbi:hypothetical protein BK120_22950 [Paenibacillus sp. FSL A5-0031]|uniref:DUF5983 family protein n=1 Tax=Paenibacillus sp. FSL A5-0031 TaxID=1920420 RepID=UPI00096C766A|nr:hypothetical protein [Paenibacillus sp. FSL A5-0031]OME78600.1 hypothetical protein BK120_22950 [Paenibacillus sp. FSL A5-0031]